MEKELKILNTEIFDVFGVDMDGNIQPTEISVLVNVRINGVEYYLDYQSTDGVSLDAYDGTEDWEAITRLFPEGIFDDGLNELIDQIKDQAQVQERWEAYIADMRDELN